MLLQAKNDRENTEAYDQLAKHAEEEWSKWQEGHPVLRCPDVLADPDVRKSSAQLRRKTWCFYDGFQGSAIRKSIEITTTY